MSSHSDGPLRRVSKNNDKVPHEATVAPAGRRQPHHHHRCGGMRIATQLTREMASLVSNMRNITNQIMTIQELLMQM